MKSENYKKETIRQWLHVSAGHQTRDRIWREILIAQEQSGRDNSLLLRPDIWRKIMKNRIVKPAVVVVIIALVVLGLLEFIGAEKTSGVLWADVVSKVGASRGLIVRYTDHSPSCKDDYSIAYTSPTHCRKDFYKDGQIIRTAYVDFTDSDTDTLIDVSHLLKIYQTITFRKSKNGLFLEWHNDWTNPGFLVQKILSAEHRKLGQKTIDGVLCEGIETTDPACFGPVPGDVKNLQVEFRLWVSVETTYPVMYETEMSAEHKGKARKTYRSVMDQFQWDVELDPNIFEPNIPSDYEDFPRPGIVEP